MPNPPNQHPSYKLDSLPEEVLVHIGKSVLGFNGVQSFIQLGRTSKRIHRVLMNKEIVPNLLESENERIFHGVFAANHDVAKASSLEEMAFCQSLARKNGMAGYHIYFNEFKIFDERSMKLYFRIIGSFLMNYPSAMMIMDVHLGRQSPLDLSDVSSLPSPSSKMAGKVKDRFRALFNSMVGKRKTIEMIGRLRVRYWKKAALKFSSRFEGTLGRFVGKGMSWITFTLRMGDIELPPTPDYYKEIEAPKEERCLAETLLVKYFRKPRDADPEEYFLTCMNETFDFTPEQSKFALDGLIDKMVHYQRTGEGEDFDALMDVILRRRNDRALHLFRTTGTSGDPYRDQFYRERHEMSDYGSGDYGFAEEMSDDDSEDYDFAQPY